jgi:major vault protein
MSQLNLDSLTAYCCTNSTSSTLANLEANAAISRGTSYTKPRTITLDNKLDGVVSIDVWTGYAINVISKDGTRKIVCGPQTVLLDYDQTLESLQLSTGNPKDTNRLLNTVYLRHENNKVSDTIFVETKDFVKAGVKVSYCVDFDEKYMDKWFNVDNYVKYLCDRVRSLVKKEVKNCTIYDFYQNYSDIVRNVALGLNETGEKSEHQGHRFFDENGMFIHDIEILGLEVEKEVAAMLVDKQHEMIRKTLELADAQREAELAEALQIAEQKKQELRTQTLINKMDLQKMEAEHKMDIQSEIARQQEAEEFAKKKAEQDIQPILDAIAEAQSQRETAKHKAVLERDAAAHDLAIATQQREADIEMAKQEAYAKTVKEIMESITPDLIAAIEVGGQRNLLSALTENMSPYAIANGESVVETTDRLLRGLPIDKSLQQILNTNND